MRDPDDPARVVAWGPGLGVNSRGPRLYWGVSASPSLHVSQSARSRRRPPPTCPAKEFPRPGKPASSRTLRSKFSRLPGPPLCSGRSQARGVGGAFCGLSARDIAGTVPAKSTKETTHGYHPRNLHQARRRRLRRHVQDPPRHRGAHHRPGRQDLRQRPRLPGLYRTALRGRRRLEPGREVERRDLRQPQDRRARVRAELGPLPPRQARTPRPKTAPPTSPCGSRATANQRRPAADHRGGASFHFCTIARRSVAVAAS